MDKHSQLFILNPTDTLVFNGQPNVQSSITLQIFNSSHINGYFNVKASHSQYYTAFPIEGIIKPYEIQEVVITLKEFSTDCEKHKITIQTAIVDTNVDAIRFWSSIKPGNYTSKILKVNISSDSKQIYSDNRDRSRRETFSKQQLELCVRRAVQDGYSLLDIEKQLFSNLHTVPKAIKQFVENQYAEYLTEVLRHEFKYIVLAMVQYENASMIQYFGDIREKLTILSPLWEDVLTKMEKKQLKNYCKMCASFDVDPVKSGQPIITSVKKYFDMCLRLFVDEVAETAIRQLLVEWFKSGKMNKAVFYQWKIFQNNEISPITIKNIDWEKLATDDHYVKQLQKILKRMNTDKFLHQEELYSILKIFVFEEPNFKISDDSFDAQALTISSRVIFLSVIKGKVEQQLEQNKKIIEVRFYAKNIFNIDDNLQNKEWHGKNVVIVADKVHVWKSCCIDVSGWGADQHVDQKKAHNGQIYGENGQDGKDGTAGESSGNIVLLTEEILKGELLTLILDGGNGEHGENGGDGADGKNGYGVTRNDLDSLLLKYTSLYWGSCGRFFTFTPKNSKEIFRKVDGYNKYVNAQFQDTNGRLMYWSYAEDYSIWIASTYDLYFLIKGTQGTAGGMGGANGVGGEGGSRGQCTARMLYSGKELFIGKIQQNAGRAGDHGILGKPGRFGKNGNDMAFVDRSTISSGKKYIGTGENMSIDFEYRMNDNDSRIDGYQKWDTQRSSHYVHFALKDISEGALMKMEIEQRTNASRKAYSKTVCKTSVILSNVVNEFARCFEQDDAVLAEACRAQEHAESEEHDEDEEKEQQAVAEEVAVLLECEDEDKNASRLRETGKTRSSWRKFAQRLNKYNHENKDNIVELAFELFQHEASEEELDKVNFKIDQIIHDFKNVVKREQLKSARYSFPQVKTLAKNIDEKMKQKRAQAAVQSKKPTLFEKYLRSVGEADLNVDASMETLVGVKPGRKYTGSAIHFFNRYQTLGVSSDLLNAMHVGFMYLKQKHHTNLVPFDAGMSFNWDDANAIKVQLEKTEAAAAAVIKTTGKKKTTEETSPLEKLQKALQLDIQYLEAAFENFNEIVTADKTKVLLKRFGLMPTAKIAKKEKEEQQQAAQMKYNNDVKEPDTNSNQPTEKSMGLLSNLKDYGSSYFNDKHGIASFAIKFYFQTRSILTFNRRLYICNVLSNAKILHPETDQILPNTLFDVNDTDFVRFMEERKRKPLDVESGRCEEFVHKHGINAAAYRFLLAYEDNINVRVYKSKRYATVKLQENFNPSADKKLMLLSENGCIYYLEADTDYRSMVAARQEVVDANEVVLFNAFNSVELLSISQFFPKEYQSTVSLWLRMFQAVNEPRALILLSILRQRFYLDGCQLSVIELQAILNAYSHATVVCLINDDFLLKISAVMPQHRILDAFLYVRIENALKRRFVPTLANEIADAIYHIDSPHLKALFPTKLNETHFDESILLKLLTMLRYAVDRFQRLEKMTLEEWIDTSQRQKWSAIGELLREYGALGYYLAFLDNRNRPEEPMLRKCLQEISRSRVLIPEKLIARIAYLIAYGEVNADENYISQLKALFKVISENYSHYLPPEQQNDEGKHVTGYPLLMNERNQNDLLAQVKQHHNDLYEPIFPTGERTVNKLQSLIVGQHDDEERKNQRQIEITNLAAQLISTQCKNVELINRINAVVEQIFSKPNGPKICLRDTQKMAVLIAAESENNTLLQVNTGEGKTLIIATLAILRAKQNKTVDVITSSPVLAARDVEKMQPLFNAFHITASHNCEEQLDARKLSYKSQVVYGDMQHFQRDFLLHHFYKKNILGDRKRQCVIVDEVDNMLLDNGNNMLYLSHNVAGLETLVSLFVFLHRIVNVPLNDIDQSSQFEKDTIRRQVLADMVGYIDKESLQKLDPNTGIGVNRVWQKLIETNLIDRDGLLRIQSENELPINLITILETTVPKTFAIQVKDYICVILHRERFIQVPRYLHSFVLRHLDAFIENTKRAMFMHHNDEYVVDIDHKNADSDLNPRVTIIDKNTGVDLATSQWSEGLHQAVQLKHSCRLSPVSLKAIFVSNVGYFKGYERINGLSGTLGSVEESKSLVALYDADLVRIPTWKPKNFYEHVPLVAANEAVWLKNIYDEVKDQVIARRSVLIICNSINQVDVVQRGIEKLYRLEKHAVPGRGKFAQPVRKHFMKGTSWKRILVNKVMTDCFNNLIVYRRDHDEFDLSGNKALQNGRAIIATNLAGRGTDIELSEGLQQAGGLHVIVAFLPDNCRIEEQAYGRASRCGHPGSGQIIAFIEDDKRIDESETPTIFQLKEFRDNAEVHRLQSLKRRYEYQTAVEESCLNKFWEHSSRALESVQSTESTSNEKALPTPMQVLYFALLDEWALWLDEKTPVIQQCARNCSDKDKRAIIASVDKFLAEHSLKNVETAIEWIRAPQPLLTLGLIELSKNNIQKADSIFQRVVATFPEYSAEAYYYMGVIQQRKTNQVYGKLSFSTIFELDTWKKWLIGTEQREIVAAINAFHESRRHFSLRRLHRGELATTVARMQQANHSIISTNGFADQHQEYVAVHEAIMGNIDKFLGKPIKPSDLRHDGRNEVNATVLCSVLMDLGITTRTILSSKLNEDQIDFICSRHPISRKDLVTKLEALRSSDSDSLSFESEGRPELEAFELRRLFHLPSRLEFWDELRRLGIFLKETKYFTTRLSETIEGLIPVNPSMFNDNQSKLLQFTDVPIDSVKLFQLEDAFKSEDNNLNRPQLKPLLECGLIATEIVALVDLNRLFNLNTYMRHFEGFKLVELQDHLNISETTAQWVISMFIEKKIIVLDNYNTYRLIGNQYRNDLLPHALCNAVEKFFADRFAYTHALEALCNSFVQAEKIPSASKFIYLPTNPYEDLLADMLVCGIAMPSRVSMAIPRKIDDNYDEATQCIDHLDDFKKIKDIIETNRPTIADANCTLVATQKYLNDNGTDSNQELKHFISSGLKQVAIVKDDTKWLWLWGLAAVVLIVAAVVAIAAFGWTIVTIGVAIGVLALAACAIYKIGSYAYYRTMRTTAKQIVTTDKKADFEFNVLRVFNAAIIDEEINKKEQNTLIKAVNDEIYDLTGRLNKCLIGDVKSTICLEEQLPEIWKNLSGLSLQVIQRKEPNIYEALVNITPLAVNQSIKTEFISEEIRFITQSCLTKIELALYNTLEDEINKKPLQRRPQAVRETFISLNNDIGCLRSEVLLKLVQLTCNKFAENLSEEAMKLHIDFAEADISEDSDSSITSNSDSDSSYDADKLTTSESSATTDFNKSSEKTLLEFWLESIQNRYIELISRELIRTLREPLLRRFLTYIKNSIAIYKESEICRQALDGDVAAKRQYHIYERVVEAKSQVEFLEREMKEVCAEYWKVHRSTCVLHHMIINKHPLPISAALCVEQALKKMLSASMPKSGVFKLILLDSGNQIVYGEAIEENNLFLQFKLNLHKEHFYISRSNFFQAEETGTHCFLYEGLCEISEQFGLIFHSAEEFTKELANSLE